ncbi:MAG: preprotein translocase subunit SecY [Verrucomicrobiota bacterium]
MLSAFTNSLKIPELRSRIFFTGMMLVIARVGANIPLPGFNPLPIKEFFESASGTGASIIGFYNMFTGGALLNGAIFGLGIMPYISASIIMQLMGAVFPSIARLQQEGDVGRMKINQYTRYLTLAICFIQSLLLLLALKWNPGQLIQGFTLEPDESLILIQPWFFVISSTIFLTTGTMILVWLGEQITQKGIGNGISLLITVSILSDLPGAVAQAIQMFNVPPELRGEIPELGFPHAIMMITLLLLVTAALVMVTQGQRKIPVQYAKRVVGRKVYGGQSSFLPLKVNYSGVMPVIFAQAIMMFPTQILNALGAASGIRFFNQISASIAWGTPGYYIVYGGMIFIFSYFWVSIMFKPIQIADDLKKYGGYIPGIRPGEPTAKFLDFVMTRLTFAGALMLTSVALFPDFLLFSFNIPQRVALFFGGTGMLITVGVVIDTMRQIETYLLQRHYDGFLKKGRIRGRGGRGASRTRQIASESGGFKEFWSVWRPIIIITVVVVVFGLIAGLVK